MAQQVFARKRGRLPEVAGDLARLPILGRQPLIAPAPRPAPQTPPCWPQLGIPRITLVLQSGGLSPGRAVCRCEARNLAKTCLGCHHPAEEDGGTCSCSLKGCRAVAAFGAISVCRPVEKQLGRSLATTSKRLRLQANTCCAIAHQVARPPAGDVRISAATGAPRRQPRPGTRAPLPTNRW